MYAEDDLLPLSSVSQFFYCRRRAALTLIEQQWVDNVFTTEGTLLHETADSGLFEARGDLRVYRRVHVRSLQLGAVGQLDVLEACRVDEEAPGLTISLGQEPGYWRLYPVEYKHGRTRTHEFEYMAQLCAEAMCLEEMLGIAIPTGYLYFGTSRRRVEVELSAELRQHVVRGFEALHRLQKEEQTPSPEPGPKCLACSMKDVCVPNMPAKRSEVYRSALMLAASSLEDFS
jgi:CRISPR-associated exonuclease Cas4